MISSVEDGMANTRSKGAQTHMTGVHRSSLGRGVMWGVAKQTKFLCSMYPIASAELEGLATSGQAHSES